MVPIPSAQVPGIYHRRLGEVMVTALTDGYLNMSLEALVGISEADAAALLAREHRLNPPRVSINCFLLRWPGHCVLVDCGSQDMMGPIAGWLPASLAAVGIAPGHITSVLLTHVHPDHSMGLTDQRTGQKLLPNAEVVVHGAEIRHWFDDAAMAAADERRRIRFFEAGRAQLAPYLGNAVREFERETEVLPGVTALPSPGHTPGHSAYLVSSGGEQLIIWGDTVHIPEVQIARPEISVAFDVDPAEAATARKRIFERVIAEDMLVGGMHTHFPGFGHLRRESGRFEFAPEQWAFTL